MIIVAGVISEILDENTYTIKAKTAEYGIVEAKAVRSENEPHVNDEVLILLFTGFNDSFGVYIPMKILANDRDFVGIERKGYKVEFMPEDGGIKVTWKNADDAEQEILIQGNSISVTCTDVTKKNKNVTTETEEAHKLTTKTLEVTSDDTKVTLGSGTVDVDADTTHKGKLTHQGTCSPSGSGGFCGIPFCPFTGAPQTGPTIQ